jgi:hypothetical protein
MLGKITELNEITLDLTGQIASDFVGNNITRKVV